MFELNQAVRDAISNNLPAAVGAELATVLKQAETDRQLVERLRGDLEESKQRERNLGARLLSQGKLAEEHKALSDGEAALMVRELAVLRKEASMTAAVATANSDAVLHVVGMFLKVPQVRTSVLSEVAVPVTGAPGGNGQPGYAGMVLQAKEAHTTTQTQE